jgi:3',5'-cyclic AMP phosphodiesterase CpdA
MALAAGLSLVLAISSSAIAHEGGDDHDHAPRLVSPAEQQAPSPIPDRIILSWTGDPSRSQAVTWRTDPSVTRGVAQIAPAEDGPKFVEKAREVEATTQPLATDLNEVHCHTAVFEDLEPGEDYLYRVGDGVNWSEWIRFTTALDEPAPFSFIYFGDAQNDVKAHWSRVIRQAYSDAPRAKFLLHAGDLINRADADGEWGDWFRAGGWVNAMMPTIATPGNHEYGRSVDDARRLSGHWRPQFAFPENGPEGLEESVYYLDFQGVRFVSLNSNEKQAEQVDWIRKVLSDNPNRWTVLTFHHPMYSAARGRDNPQLRELWQPIFDEYAVDLVLTGHDHTYARSGLVTLEENLAEGARAQTGDSGTVYVVSVSGPKMYDLEREDWMQRAAEDTQLYQVISIDGPVLIYQARTATGKLYDAFTLRKQADGPNRLINAIPDEPERLRAPEPAAVGAGASD